MLLSSDPESESVSEKKRLVSLTLKGKFTQITKRKRFIALIAFPQVVKLSVCDILAKLLNKYG